MVENVKQESADCEQNKYCKQFKDQTCVIIPGLFEKAVHFNKLLLPDSIISGYLFAGHDGRIFFS